MGQIDLVLWLSVVSVWGDYELGTNAKSNLEIVPTVRFLGL